MTGTVHTPETLIPLVGAFVRSSELTNRGWKFAENASQITVGMTAVAYGHGRWRRGLVTKAGPKNVRVEYVTPTNIEETRRYGRGEVPVRGATAKVTETLILPALPAPAAPAAGGDAAPASAPAYHPAILPADVLELATDPAALF